MGRYKYFNKGPSALPNLKESLSGRMLLEVISSANLDWYTRTQSRTLTPCINMTQGRYARFSTMKSLSSSIVSQSLISCLGSMCWTSWPNYGGVRAMPPVHTPTCTSSYSFHKNSLREIESGQWFGKYAAREIQALYGIDINTELENNNNKLHFYQLHKPFWLKPVVGVLCLFCLNLNWCWIDIDPELLCPILEAGV